MATRALRNRTLLTEEFAEIGTGKGELLVQDSPADFVVYATGHAQIRSMTVTLDVCDQPAVTAMNLLERCH